MAAALRIGWTVVDQLTLVERSWPLLRRLTAAHVALYRASRGLIGHRFPGSPPMLLLDHVGAKSAAKRTTPLVYTRDGKNVILVASKGGYPKNPAWFHNLLAHPDTTVQIGSERRAVHARVADPQERERLWPKAVEAYGGFEDYRRRTEREIPLVILEPRAAR
jgi:deazaflavin-dependent oxidoreductase (nitroreductase family)